MLIDRTAHRVVDLRAMGWGILNSKRSGSTLSPRPAPYASGFCSRDFPSPYKCKTRQDKIYYVPIYPRKRKWIGKFSSSRQTIPFLSTRFCSSNSSNNFIGYRLVAVWNTPIKRNPIDRRYSVAKTDAKYETAHTTLWEIFHGSTSFRRTSVPCGTPSESTSCIASSLSAVFTGFNLIMILDLPQALFWISHPFFGFLSIDMYCGKPILIQKNHCCRTTLALSHTRRSGPMEKNAILCDYWNV